MRCAVIINVGAGGAGSEGLAERVRAVLQAAGVEAVVECVAGPEVSRVARRAAADSSFDAVVAAGGDGTVSTVAAALVGSRKPLGVLPLGTRNHFARDVGLPLALEAAARVIARGQVRRVDVADVNQHVFVNNSSLGLYPHAVRAREQLRAREYLRKRLNKWVAMAWALVRVALRLRPLTVRIVSDQGTLPRRTPLVFVGNNRYDTALIANQRRPALDRGTLGVYVARERTPLGLVRLALRALLGRLDPRRDVDSLEVAQLAIHSHHRTLRVAVDGEVLHLRPPIRYRIHPRALRVFAPQPP